MLGEMILHTLTSWYNLSLLTQGSNVTILKYNNRERSERFLKLKALYNLTKKRKKKKNAQTPIIIQINGIQAYKTYEN